MVSCLRCYAAITPGDHRWRIGVRFRGKAACVPAFFCAECGDGLAVLEALTGGRMEVATSWAGVPFISDLSGDVLFEVRTRRREPPL